MTTKRVFKSGNSQAVRLPKEFRMEGDEVYIKKHGRVVVLLPKEKSWEILVESLNMFEDGLKINRNQPVEFDKREPLFE